MWRPFCFLICFLMNCPLLTCRIVKVDLKFPIRPFVSSAAKDLISQVFVATPNAIFFLDDVMAMALTSRMWQMLVKDSSQRIPLHKVLEHQWIVQNADPTGVYKGWKLRRLYSSDHYFDQTQLWLFFLWRVVIDEIFNQSGRDVSSGFLM